MVNFLPISHRAHEDLRILSDRIHGMFRIAQNQNGRAEPWLNPCLRSHIHRPKKMHSSPWTRGLSPAIAGICAAPYSHSSHSDRRDRHSSQSDGWFFPFCQNSPSSSPPTWTLCVGRWMFDPIPLQVSSFRSQVFPAAPSHLSRRNLMKADQCNQCRCRL